MVSAPRRSSPRSTPTSRRSSVTRSSSPRASRSSTASFPARWTSRPSRTYLQPPEDQTDITHVIKGVIEAESGAIDFYNQLIEETETIDPVTQDMVIAILRDEEGHRRLFEGFLREYEARGQGLAAAHERRGRCQHRPPTWTAHRPSPPRIAWIALGRFRSHHMTDSAASLTYYAMMSLFPALLAAISLLSLARRLRPARPTPPRTWPTTAPTRRPATRPRRARQADLDVRRQVGPDVRVSA